MPLRCCAPKQRRPASGTSGVSRVCTASTAARSAHFRGERHVLKQLRYAAALSGSVHVLYKLQGGLLGVALATGRRRTYIAGDDKCAPNVFSPLYVMSEWGARLSARVVRSHRNSSAQARNKGRTEEAVAIFVLLVHAAQERRYTRRNTSAQQSRPRSRVATKRATRTQQDLAEPHVLTHPLAAARCS